MITIQPRSKEFELVDDPTIDVWTMSGGHCDENHEIMSRWSSEKVSRCHLWYDLAHQSPPIKTRTTTAKKETMTTRIPAIFLASPPFGPSSGFCVSSPSSHKSQVSASGSGEDSTDMRLSSKGHARPSFKKYVRADKRKGKEGWVSQLKWNPFSARSQDIWSDWTNKWVVEVIILSMGKWYQSNLFFTSSGGQKTAATIFIQAQIAVFSVYS